ncbi:MAG: hypothetical protein HY200_04590 [Nitrospirae bacterium]|nr:hypothetical protein [Nitrospirota bacterium]MBI3594214.1 hypothetical protein [Nitrospirota bacterium]
MPGVKGCLGCLAALFGILGIFLAITLSFSFYLIPLAFLLFIGSLILISLALGPTSPPNRGSNKPDDPSRDDT